MDHVKKHQSVICSKPTKDFLKIRSKIKQINAYGYKDVFSISDYQLTLFPAGHILGSSMLLIEKGDDSLLFSGDIKVNPSLSCEEIEIPKAKQLIVEASFGSKEFIFPKKDALKDQIKNALDSIENTAVFFTYTLGKSQEILAYLTEMTDKPIYIHQSISVLNKVYKKHHISMADTFPIKRFDSDGTYIIPVHLRHFSILKDKLYTAIYTTGWALDPEKVKQMQCDICLPVSDHAGFDELLAFVKAVEPEKIYTHHGRPLFSTHLQGLGYNVHHIDENQFNEG